MIQILLLLWYSLKYLNLNFIKIINFNIIKYSDFKIIGIFTSTLSFAKKSSTIESNSFSTAKPNAVLWIIIKKFYKKKIIIKFH